MTAAPPLPKPLAAPPLPAPERTKHRLLELLKRHGPQTVQDLAGHLGMSVPGARRHLGDLQEQGLVEARTERPGGRGRPQHVFLLTDRGEAAFPKTYSTLCVDVLRHVQELYGEGAVLQVLDARSAELAGRLQADLPATLPLEERVQRLGTWLMGAGFDAVVEPGEGGAHYIVKRNCPNLTVARQYPELCLSELHMFVEVLGVPVTRETRIACGQGSCRYRIGP
ncbi:transcriptional regulator [Deinococcus metallilatus]|uniref:Transcriptional regulator n=1 Tax=Deinococcus metallilatus TaxID=1211322 RepID=A0AAJ5JY64_9DEIO|nr:metalloregulator ArsR/SmtB family transcription factor [Deinococcus metallilatus]MBB5295902.1 putative ArsR family transcriptional regulator [Deinococcus metallilatus]QBY08264.1 transcriptional regulator [Deinococcus metallilatus]RXJ11995.1 transcriptional regulator [Deinococcus metallilatus]TLK25773.1 transcriptional regulator [Deinococcus metallilatus]GMA14564.1 transcriptional regulator [Deinococcus metallilatus]